MQTDGLNGGGIWDIIEYNGSMYVTMVTDKSIDGHINKQGFAMYRGDKHEDGSFTWTQVIGDHDTSGYDFGLGINYSMSCNMWVYNGYLYLGTYNDPHAGPGGDPRLRQLRAAVQRSGPLHLSVPHGRRRQLPAGGR